MYKFRLDPSNKEKEFFEEQFELCRQTYNWLLLHCRDTYRESGKTPTQHDLTKLLIPLKQQRPELYRVYAQVLQNICKRIKDSYTGFYARRRAGLKAGLPRFKKYGTYKSITYPQVGRHGLKIKDNRLTLSKIGKKRVKQHREIRGQVKTLTIKRMATGKWFACFSCIVDDVVKEKLATDRLSPISHPILHEKWDHISPMR